MQFGVPVFVHVLLFTNNIGGHRFKTIRLAVFLFPLKGTLIVVCHSQSDDFQVSKTNKRLFVEMVHATSCFLPSEVWKQALFAVVSGAYELAIQVHIGFFTAIETRCADSFTFFFNSAISALSLLA